MGPVGMMRSSGKPKLFAVIGLFLDFFPQFISTSECVLKSLWWVVGFLNLVSTPGACLSRLRLGLVRWVIGLGWPRLGMAKLLTSQGPDWSRPGPGA